MSSIGSQRTRVIPHYAAGTGQRVGTGLLLGLSFCTLVLLIQRFDVPTALGLLVLLAAAAAMVVRPEIATLLAVFLIYINFPAILTKQHGLPHSVAGSFILILGFPLAHSLIIQRQSLKADLTFYLMFVFLAVATASSLMATDRTMAVQWVKELVLEGLLLYWLVFNVIRSMPTLRRVIWTVLFAGAFLSALSLYQTVTGSYEQEFGGLAYRNYRPVQADLVPEDREKPVKRRTWDRAQGPLSEPNRFAQILAVLVPLAAFTYRNARTQRARLYAAACGSLIVIGVILTLSRGAMVGLLVLTIMLVALRWMRLSRVLVCVACLVVAAPAVPYFSHTVTKLTRVVGVVGAGTETGTAAQELDTSAGLRATVMLSALHVFLDHPFMGVGPAQFARFYSQSYGRNPDSNVRDLPPGNWRAHSLYLEIGAELGLAGLSVFLAMVAMLLRNLWRARRSWMQRWPELSDLATALALSLITYQVTGLFLHLSYQPYYWFLLAIAGATLQLARVAPNEITGHGRYARQVSRAV